MVEEEIIIIIIIIIAKFNAGRERERRPEQCLFPDEKDRVPEALMITPDERREVADEANRQAKATSAARSSTGKTVLEQVSVDRRAAHIQLETISISQDRLIYLG